MNCLRFQVGGWIVEPACNDSQRLFLNKDRNVHRECNVICSAQKLFVEMFRD